MRIGRPKGSKSGYTLSPEARVQRQLAPLKHGKYSQVMSKVIKENDKKDVFDGELEKYKLEAWRKLAANPAMFLAERLVTMEAFVNSKLANGDIDDETFIKYQRLLLDFAKEVNKYSQVSADTKANIIKTIANNEQVLDFDVDIRPIIPDDELEENGETEDNI